MLSNPWQGVEHAGFIEGDVEGVRVRVHLRIISKDGRPYVLRSAIAFDAEGERLKTIRQEFVDDVEAYRG